MGSAIRLTYGSGANDGRSVRAERERFVIGRDPVCDLVLVNGRTMDGSLAAYCSAIDGGEGSAGATFTVVRSGSSRPVEVTVPFD